MCPFIYSLISSNNEHCAERVKECLWGKCLCIQMAEIFQNSLTLEFTLQDVQAHGELSSVTSELSAAFSSSCLPCSSMGSLHIWSTILLRVCSQGCCSHLFPHCSPEENLPVWNEGKKPNQLSILSSLSLKRESGENWQQNRVQSLSDLQIHAEVQHG